MACVRVEGFSYTYPGDSVPALETINFVIEQGAFVVVAGASGSGKSTLGKALAGFLFQDDPPQFTGKIIVNDVDMAHIPLYETSERVAYVQQNPEDQFCTLSVLDEIAFALENACMDSEVIDGRIDQALKIVGGLDLRERLLATLSGGEKQKVAIASMLALSPDVLILDEPTSNLDPNATQQIFETLHTFRELEKLTVIIIEHKLSQLSAFDPNLLVMEEGKIVTTTSLKDYMQGQRYGQSRQPSSSVQSIPQEDPVLDIAHLHVGLNGKEILSDINFCLYPGEFVAVMGPNGSGKSTLLRTIMGFHKPTRGEVVGFGMNLAQEKISSLVKHIGFIFQNPDHQLFAQSVWEEATLTLKNLDLLQQDSIDKAQALLKDIGLGDRMDEHPQRLSYGEKRRLNLACVILHNPQLLLIDEFLIGQDMPNAHRWMKALRNYASDQKTVLLVNHHMDLTQAYCDRVMFLDAGKLVLDAPARSAWTALKDKGYDAFLPHCQEKLVHA